jgi:hypothetical protein
MANYGASRSGSSFPVIHGLLGVAKLRIVGFNRCLQGIECETPFVWRSLDKEFKVLPLRLSWVLRSVSQPVAIGALNGILPREQVLETPVT